MTRRHISLRRRWRMQDIEAPAHKCTCVSVTDDISGESGSTLLHFQINEK